MNNVEPETTTLHELKLLLKVFPKTIHKPAFGNEHLCSMDQHEKTTLQQCGYRLRKSTIANKVKNHKQLLYTAAKNKKQLLK